MSIYVAFSRLCNLDEYNVFCYYFEPCCNLIKESGEAMGKTSEFHVFFIMDLNKKSLANLTTYKAIAVPGTGKLSNQLMKDALVLADLQ
jgi:hypothetical protein